MGKKYIIELLDDCRSEFKGIMVFGLTQEKQISVELIPEESLTPYTEPDLDAIRKEAYDKGYTDAAYNCHERCAFLDDAKKEAYRRGYETAKHECEDCNANAVKIADDKAHEAYQKGLEDAWETVKELFNFTFDEQATIFKTTSVRDILRKYSASETIEKIDAYEQEKEEQIQVGDEVEDGVANLIVLEINEDGTVSGFDDEGSIIHATPRKKTGRYFPEIAEVLQKMKE